jgi:hypothetical protein
VVQPPKFPNTRNLLDAQELLAIFGQHASVDFVDKGKEGAVHELRAGDAEQHLHGVVCPNDLVVSRRDQHADGGVIEHALGEYEGTFGLGPTRAEADTCLTHLLSHQLTSFVTIDSDASVAKVRFTCSPLVCASDFV